MMANTWAEVYRDLGDDALGDPVSATEPVPGLERVVIAITEKSRQIIDPDTNELRIVRYGVGRARVGTDIKTDDRIHDLTSGKWWAVGQVSTASPSFTGNRALSFDLRAS
jgi:lipoprotein-anchoring transpeptidase ErfK/SrfK